MVKMRKTIMLLAAGIAIVAAGCSPDSESEQTSTATESVVSSQAEMAHQFEGSPAPETMVAAADPKFPLGGKVMMMGDHMTGMESTEATVVGAYDTTLYQVTYTPSTGGERVEDHKWVAYEEIEASKEPITEGDTVVLLADHMTGMEGQEAEITGIHKGIAYMVDYTDQETGSTVTNHKWLSEEEMEKVAD